MFDPIDPEFRPIVDGDMLPETPRTLLTTGRFSHVPIIMGTVKDEFGTCHTILIIGLSQPGGGTVVSVLDFGLTGLEFASTSYLKTDHLDFSPSGP